MLGILRRLNFGLIVLLKGILVVVFAILVLDVLWGVASRYLLGSQAAWSEELARLLMVWLALLGAALVCREERHLGLDVIVRSWPESVQRVDRIVVFLAVFIFATVIMLIGGWQLVSHRFESGQLLPALGIAKAWFYLALPVSGGLISLFSIESMCLTLFERSSDAGLEEAT